MFFQHERPMDTNPYQAPLGVEPADPVADALPRRSWFMYLLGTCCFGISLFLTAISLTVPAHVRQKVPIWLVLGTLAVSWAAMGTGMFTRRDRLALIGFTLFALLLGAAIIVRVIRVVGS
jgi:FtsH-binding integral membrane protein